MKRLTLTIRAEPAGRDEYGRDADARLKALLKAMKRAYGWRCERICAADDAKARIEP